jgi:hypothetical protein
VIVTVCSCTKGEKDDTPQFAGSLPHWKNNESIVIGKKLTAFYRRMIK